MTVADQWFRELDPILRERLYARFRDFAYDHAHYTALPAYPERFNSSDVIDTGLREAIHDAARDLELRMAESRMP